MNKISKLLITDKQEKIRTQWRLTILSMALIYSILVATAMFFDIRVGVVAIVFLIPILILFAIIWFCAYRKPGTKLLSYMLFVKSFKLLLLIIMSFASRGKWSALIWPLTISLVWLYIASWRLRAVNKAIQDSNFLNGSIGKTRPNSVTL